MYRAGFSTLARSGSIRGHRLDIWNLSVPDGPRITPWSLPETAHRDVGDQGHTGEGGDRARAPVAHERQRDARDGHDPHRHPHVLEDLEHEDGKYADADERAEEVTGEEGGSPRPPDHDREQRQQRRRAEEAELLAYGGEDEVGVLLGNEPARRLRAVARAAPGGAPLARRRLRPV